MARSYQSLNHEDTLFTKLLNIVIDIECVFNLHSLQHGVQYDESASPPHPSAAVDQ